MEVPEVDEVFGQPEVFQDWRGRVHTDPTCPAGLGLRVIDSLTKIPTAPLCSCTERSPEPDTRRHDDHYTTQRGTGPGRKAVGKTSKAKHQAEMARRFRAQTTKEAGEMARKGPVKTINDYLASLLGWAFFWGALGAGSLALLADRVGWEGAPIGYVFLLCSFVGGAAVIKSDIEEARYRRARRRRAR